MVKGISSINGYIKTGVIAAMLAGSAALYASNPIKKDTEQNQTEVVSKAGAEAVKAANMQSVQQNSVPTVHNTNLDNTFRKFIETEDDKVYVNTVINNVYKNKGLFLGTSLMQHLIDFQQFFAFLTQNADILIKNNINPSLGKQIKSFGPQFFETVEPSAEKILDLADKIHNQEVEKNLDFKHVAGFWDVHKSVNEFVNNSEFLSRDDINKFYDEFCGYLIDIEPKTDLVSSSDILARQMFILDKIAYNKILEKLNIFNNSNFSYDNKNLQDYFNMWMNSVKPDNKY